MKVTIKVKIKKITNTFSSFKKFINAAFPVFPCLDLEDNFIKRLTNALFLGLKKELIFEIPPKKIC